MANFSRHYFGYFNLSVFGYFCLTLTEERKIRTHRLIEIGAAVESVLGRCIELEEIPKLIAFLNKQEMNGKFFSKAMQKSPDTDIIREEVGESGVS